MGRTLPLLQTGLCPYWLLAVSLSSMARLGSLRTLCLSPQQDRVPYFSFTTHRHPPVFVHKLKFTVGDVCLKHLE